MDRVTWLADRLADVPMRTRQMVATVGGIVAGVLLVATGWSVGQVLGALLIGAALLLARGGTRWSEAWLRHPGRQAELTWRRVQTGAPVWAWPATVGVLLVAGLVVLAAELLSRGDLGRGTLGDLGKGAIALAMMGSLAFWSTNGLAWRPRRIPGC